jgi:hypothetical protein
MASHVLTNDQLLESQDIVARLREFAVRMGDRHGEDNPVLTAGMVQAVLDDEPGKLADLEAAAGL